MLTQWCRRRHDEPPGFAMLNLTRLHLGIAHESQFQGLGIRSQKGILEARSKPSKRSPSVAVAPTATSVGRSDGLRVLEIVVFPIFWVAMGGLWSRLRPAAPTWSRPRGGGKR